MNTLDLIGNTPLVEITGLDTGPCRLFAKLENQNPGGSIKDRIGKSMIEAFERDGRLKPGGTLVEATAGNTGLGLAQVAARKGYRLVLVIPDKMSREKVQHLKALGVEVVMTRSDVEKGHPEYYQDKAEKLAAEIPGAVYVNQFGNPANPLAHETGTGPEIWEQMDHDVDAIVCGVGSAGTITGLSRFFAGVSPKTTFVLADPKGSVLAEYTRSGTMPKAGSWLVEGIGEDFLPPIADLLRVGAAYEISDKDSFLAARELLAKEGILGGSSTGTLLAAALRYCREQTEPKRVVFFVCDSGNKYLSKMYNDHWMADHGFLDRPKTGDLRDLIARRHGVGDTVTLAPDDTLQVAYGRMKLYDVSQLPVTRGDAVVGILDESDLLLSVMGDAAAWKTSVGDVMTTKLETLPPTADVSDLLPIFGRDRVAIIVEDGRFLGLITRIDLLNHLRTRADA
ncbi:MAG: pyridoxal-phosphate dependent enzyme [Caenispirillum bisanense]|nr:pyridoxal-phosphate dependent enzyme [Caenispirillum bisanense]MCA1973919.1 pyridoxal-phosphate dependent enzyme [Caenispirillum sp.]